MTPPSPGRAIKTVDDGQTWLKSSRSGTEGNCVEVTHGFVRDTKDPATWLPIGEAAWLAFLGDAKAMSRH
jgi:hypothetical protein